MILTKQILLDDLAWILNQAKAIGCVPDYELITGSVVFKYYSGEEPEFIEGDVFRIIVPLNEEYSYDNTRDGSIDEIKREVEERLEKEQRRFGEKSD